MVTLSRNSRVAGMIRAAMMAETVSAACSSSGKWTSMVFFVRGLGTSLTVISEKTPRVPSDEMRSWLRL